MNTRTANISLVVVFFVFVALIMFSVPALAQLSAGTGSIQGTVTDPGGAVIPGAKVTVTGKATGQKLTLTTTSSGEYNTGPLVPGDYTVRVEAKGFRTTENPETVQVTTITPGNIRLTVGSESQVVTVEGTAVQVNTEQATVQGVLTAQQIENLPINGRNFLDLAQLEPGVQIQDGGNFDPTKNGFSSISFGGRYGRTARIEVDGIDVSDETVGTTTQNISAGAIQEFNIQQSTLDLSTELTSSGAVNVVTKSGTNSLHGEGFYLFRDRALSAAFPGGQTRPYQRNHVGGSLGGRIWKDKVFFFANVEHIKQDLFAPLTFSPPFDIFNGGFNSPFRDGEALGRLDFNLWKSARAFYRFTYETNSDVRSFRPDYQAFANRDNTPSHVLGLDFGTGRFSHSIRFGYEKFQNHIADAVLGSSIFNPDKLISIRISGSSPTLRTGVNLLAPQATFQTNKQVKYDGSWLKGSHTIRYGAGVNRILGGGFAAFFGLQPRVSSLASRAAVAAAGPFPGGAANLLNYPVTAIVLGNGQGFFTEIPQFGLPAGGQFDTRVTWYAGDSWKIKPNFTVTYGIHYNRDTGRQDSDLAPLTCAQIDTTVFSPPPCTGSSLILDQFGFIPGLGNRVRQPNTNFGPQLGIAWDPFKDGKTVIRAGVGLFYENAVFNNILFDRPSKLAKGLFFGTASLCPSGALSLPGGGSITSIDGLDIKTQICGQPIGTVDKAIADLQALFQQATRSAGVSANPNFLGGILANGGNSTGNNFIAPNYKTPRSVQMNVGIQRELMKGTVVSLDFLRNVGTHFLLAVDTNHVGDSRFLNTAAALNAISATNSSFGCGTGTDAASINCAIAAGAIIGDFAGNGLDNGKSFLFGLPAAAFGLTPGTGAAFGGINPNVGENEMLFPVGRSVYNAMQVKLRQDIKQPVTGLTHMTIQVAYSLSRFLGNVPDQDFIDNANDFRNPTRFIGPNALDRRHQFSFGSTFDLPWSIKTSLVGHFSSRLPQDIRLEDQGRSGELFHTDFYGDGRVGGAVGNAFLPGTSVGSFGRGVTASNINNFIDKYNQTQAGTLTPAGQALVNAGLFTPAQLIALGAVKDTLERAVPGQRDMDPFKDVDFKFSKVIHIGERVGLEPSVSIYNLLNLVNFDGSPVSLMSGILTACPGNITTCTGKPTQGSVLNTTRANRSNRTGVGTGVFSIGSPRQIEFGLRLSF